MIESKLFMQENHSQWPRSGTKQSRIITDAWLSWWVCLGLVANRMMNIYRLSLQNTRNQHYLSKNMIVFQRKQ